MCRSQGLPFLSCFYDLGKFSARMSPAARYFELPILFHKCMTSPRIIHETRYNCSILDLHDRGTVASITDKHITADLAKRTLQKVIDSQPGINLNKLLLYSYQGSQYISKEFTEFCESLNITQSMSKAGYPYDNAPKERYFNTLKNDLINHHYYRTEEEFYKSTEEFAYVHYNHVRPHSYNNYKTPFEARYWAT